MKRIFKAIGILLLSGALICPTVSAQNRGRGNGGGGGGVHQPTSSPSQRPGNQGQRPGNSGQRPGNQGGQRPGGGNQGNQGNPGNQGGQRPGGGNQGNPGNQGGQRPGGGNQGNPGNGMGHRPGNDRPGGPGGPGATARPNNNYGWGGGAHGPAQPHMPAYRPWSRPTPPPSWRPAPGWRPFRSILGITLGTAFNLSINALLQSGYTINSYGNNEIYLANVPMLNLMWPNAIMYYNGAGGLCGSQFIYSTPGYNMNQYNMAYTTLASSYGAPVSIQNLANGVEATWWGTGNQFIRLTYTSNYTSAGYLRYFTTLSFGI